MNPPVAVRRRWVPLVLLGALMACGDDVETVDVVEPAATEEESAPAAKTSGFLPPAEQERQDELRGWSACLRRTAPHVEHSWRRYSAAIDPETGRPRRRSEAEPFIHRVETDAAVCRTLPDPAEGSELVPEHLRKTVASYIAAVEDYASISEQLAPYYDTKGHKDDGWQRGEELAPKLSAAHDAVAKTGDELRRGLREARDEADEAALAAMRDADAPAVAGLAIATGRDARAIRACFEVETPDPSSCQAALDAFKATRGLVSEAVENPPETQYVFWLGALSRTSGRLVDATQEAIDALTPSNGRRRATYSDAHRDAVFAAATHVEDVADNVRYGL